MVCQPKVIFQEFWLNHTHVTLFSTQFCLSTFASVWLLLPFLLSKTYFKKITFHSIPKEKQCQRMIGAFLGMQRENGGCIGIYLLVRNNSFYFYIFLCQILTWWKSVQNKTHYVFVALILSSIILWSSTCMYECTLEKGFSFLAIWKSENGLKITIFPLTS